MARRNPEIHGHRGSRGTHPENTLPAFAEARDCGADFFELDTQLTADGDAVVFHDPVISARVCRRRDGKPLVPVTVRELKVRDLAAFECGSVAQAKYPRQKLEAGLSIPTLDETLAWVATTQGFGVNIEMKTDTVTPLTEGEIRAYTDRVLELVEGHGLRKRVLLQSFDFRPLMVARRRVPDLRTSCLFENDADFAAEAVKVGANAVGPHFSLLGPERIAACRVAGLKVIPWTVNESADWARLIQWGVDGLITDYPRDLKSFLASNPPD